MTIRSQRVEELNKWNEASSHQNSKGAEMQPCQRLRQPFVVTSLNVEGIPSDLDWSCALYTPAFRLIKSCRLGVQAASC